MCWSESTRSVCLFLWEKLRRLCTFHFVLSSPDSTPIIPCLPQQENILYFFYQYSFVLTLITVNSDTWLYMKDYICDKKWALLLFKSLPTDPKSMTHANISQSWHVNNEKKWLSVRHWSPKVISILQWRQSMITWISTPCVSWEQKVYPPPL